VRLSSHSDSPPARADSADALRVSTATLRRLGFADPRAAKANLNLLTPTPRDAELLAPVLPSLLAELAAAPDPDMALNNLERYAAVVDRAVFFQTLATHPGAAHLLARLFGSSQFLADALRRRPNLLAWLLEPRTMRQWLPDELEADLSLALGAFTTREARMNALRRFKYRQLLRIASRDLLGDAEVAVTTEELAHLADVCLGEAGRFCDAALNAQYGAPHGESGAPTGLAVIGMGKLGGEELNYSSDIDLILVYGEDGETAGGLGGRLSNGEYFTRLGKDLLAFLESATDEGAAFRVDLRLRPEGRVGSVALSLEGYRVYYAERAELWERQALLKARLSAGDEHVGARFLERARGVVYRPGVDPKIVDAVRDMKREIDRSLRERTRGDGERDNVKLGRGGIREIEFLVQALQLLYGGDDPWLRERNTLKALFRLAERGYLAPGLGRTLSEAYVHLRAVEHGLQMLHEFQTHTLPSDPVALGRLARRLGIAGRPRTAARAFARRHRAIREAVHRAFREFFAGPREPAVRVRPPSLLALRATGFADPERARENLRLIVEGRPLVPYAGALRRALARLMPALLDALWKSPNPDEALNQFERFLAAAGPRAGLIELLAAEPEVLEGLTRLCAGGDLLTQLLIAQPELLTSLADPAEMRQPKGEPAFRTALATVFAPDLGPGERRDRLRRLKQAEELGVAWRYLLGVTDIAGYSREMTALAQATVLAGWLLVLSYLVERHGVPRTADGRFIPAVVIGLGKLGGRELTTGSDLDIFVVYGTEASARPSNGRTSSATAEGATDSAARVDAHTFWDTAVERLAGALGDITAAGVAFPVDLRLRAGSKGSGFASSLDAAERYYAEYGDLWERQSLTRARLVLGDRRLGRRVLARARRYVYGAPLGPRGLKEIADVRTRVEVELGRETPGRVNVKLGRGGLVDVEFLTQALQLVHGHAHPQVRRPATVAALKALGRIGALEPAAVEALLDHHRFLRRVSAALRLLSARPPDTLELAGPMPARVAAALGYPSREVFLEDYRRRTTAVRAIYTEVMTRGSEGAG
jgi:[glutamine synthetase] adenylyltransferase / [glutamine synthetase]-adenylyl-L-tyrosine phosphorylase